jgi:putative membrane protein insertion efficiency factor
VKYVGIGAVRLYQLLISPLVPPNTCKYHPTCSQYAIDALHKYGLVRGTAKAVWRLLRCNPWSRGGVDYA